VPERQEESFPVSWANDHLVTRRQFTQCLTGVSGALFTAGAALTATTAFPPGADPAPPVPVARIDELAVGGSRTFFHPSVDGPCLLVRPAADRVAAFGQNCTHLRCPVVYEANAGRLACPCHAGYFDAEDGRVLAGPPVRPLPRIRLERRGDEVWALGLLP
jgi:Rieske Fe-S protein